MPICGSLSIYSTANASKFFFIFTFFDEDKEESFLISDYQLAKYLRSETEKKGKNKLSELLKDVRNELELERADIISETDEIKKLLKFDGKLY